MCADDSTHPKNKTKTENLDKKIHVSHGMCHLSLVMRHMSCVMCHILHVTCHMSLTPIATAADPPSANSPTMHNWLVCEDQKRKSTFSVGRF